MDKTIKLNANKEISVPPVAKLIGFVPLEIKRGEALFMLETGGTF